MPSELASRPEYVALLSAAGVASEGLGGALQNIAGQPLLEWQIHALRRRGIDTFLIEVDNVSGSLLGLADRVRGDNAKVEFIRSVKELQSFLTTGQRLVVQAEAHYFSPSLVKQLIAEPVPFIATLDGRDENVAFERIDMNSRWAGFAVLDANLALSLNDLPDGWNIGSSLLRHAIQNGSKLIPIAQVHTQTGELARISSADDGSRLTDKILAVRIQGTSGFIEKYLVGALAKKLSPMIWSSQSGVPLMRWSSLVGAVGSLVCALTAWSVPAAALALLAILTRKMVDFLGGWGEFKKKRRLESCAFWLALVGSALATAWMSADYGTEVIAFMLIITGLTVIPYRMALPRWATALLQSPALLAGFFVLATSLSAFSSGAKFVAMGQVALLVAGLYFPQKSDKNSDQA